MFDLAATASSAQTEAFLLPTQEPLPAEDADEQLERDLKGQCLLCSMCGLGFSLASPTCEADVDEEPEKYLNGAGLGLAERVQAHGATTPGSPRRLPTTQHCYQP